MKLKKVTLIALLLFVGFFVTLLFVPAKVPEFVSVTNTLENTTGVVTTSPTKKPTTPVVENLNVLDLAHVAKHNTANDCYLIVKSSVYNVTNFIGEHPGGRRKIVDMCGQEATAVFSAIHSNFAWNLLKDFYVGPLVK